MNRFRIAAARLTSTGRRRLTNQIEQALAPISSPHPRVRAGFMAAAEAQFEESR